MVSLSLILLRQPSAGYIDDINDGFVMVSSSLILLHQPSAGDIDDGFVMVSESLLPLHQLSAGHSVDKFGNEVCLKQWQLIFVLLSINLRKVGKTSRNSSEGNFRDKLTYLLIIILKQFIIIYG